MDKTRKRQQAQKSKDMFNNETSSQKVQNQNGTHNSVKEGMGPNTKR